MKNRNYIVTLLSLLILGSLVVWQIIHLKKSHQLKTEIAHQEMQTTLMESAIELRKAEKNDDELRTNGLKNKTLTDSVLLKNFKKFNQKIEWGFYNGLGEPIDKSNNKSNKKELINSPLKVCMSCLLMIGIIDNSDGEKVDRSDLDERSYILDHSPAQMRDIQGLDIANLRYIHIYSIPEEMQLTSYVVPFIFLVGLSCLFIWLFMLINKQTKLIQQKNEFVNHLSHQFQTPLSSIKLSANLLTKKAVKNQDELLQIIQTESNRLENHIKTVLHWVKSDADRLRVDKKRIGVTDIIERSLKQMKPVFLTNNTVINFIPPEEELYINADENHLQLMLFNIWENAIKHNEKAVILKISCKDLGSHIGINTSDNGKGLQEKANTEKFKGLGLAYINRIMKEHNGSMELRNDGQGLSIYLKFLKND